MNHTVRFYSFSYQFPLSWTLFFSKIAIFKWVSQIVLQNQLNPLKIYKIKSPDVLTGINRRKNKTAKEGEIARDSWANLHEESTGKFRGFTIRIELYSRIEIDNSITLNMPGSLPFFQINSLNWIIFLSCSLTPPSVISLVNQSHRCSKTGFIHLTYSFWLKFHQRGWLS